MSLRKIIRGADEGTRRSFLSGMAQSMLGVGAAATFGPDLVANSLRLGSPLLNQDPKKTKAGQKPIVQLARSAMRSHKCLQTVHDKTAYRPEDRITAMAFDPIHSRLLTGTTKTRGRHGHRQEYVAF